MGCFSIAIQAKPAHTDSVKQFVAAYNHQDIDKMMSLVTDDITWFSASAFSITEITRGKTNMKKELSADFASGNKTVSTLFNLKGVGNTVSAVEQASWTKGETQKSQCAISIYQFAKGKIRSVTYYDAAPCE